jgi:hypothetical protein
MLKYREFIRLRLMAIAVILPTMFFFALAIEGSAWWFVAVAVYPLLLLAVVVRFNRKQ